VVSSTPRPQFTPGKEPVPILQEARLAPGPFWTGGKSRPHRDPIPDCPAPSQYIHTYTHTYIYIYIHIHARTHTHTHTYTHTHTHTHTRTSQYRNAVWAKEKDELSTLFRISSFIFSLRPTWYLYYLSDSCWQSLN